MSEWLASADDQASQPLYFSLMGYGMHQTCGRPGHIQDFAERGRFGGLIGGVAHNSSVLGIGIDEDTALLMRGTPCGCWVGRRLHLDGNGASYSDVAGAKAEVTLERHDVRVHVLGEGSRYDLRRRAPTPANGRS